MRRMAMLWATATVAMLVWAAPALATFHETRVTEVALSRDGSTTEQFVELQDPAEPYPDIEGPYELVVYDGAGTLVGSQPLAATSLRADAPLGPMLISTPQYDAAAGTTGKFTLSIALPASGQACFAHLASPSLVHCMAWGTITNPLTGSGGAIAGPAPGDGQSLQTQCNGTAAVGAPTPGAPNAKLVPACTDNPPTAHFTFSPTNPTAGQTITFDGSPSTDPDAGDHITSWQWLFDGVGTTTSTPTTTHAFTAGSHIVSLTVFDTFGSSSPAISTTVTVAPAGGPPPPPPPPPAPTVTCKVPKLKGLTLPRAKKKLKAAHCALGRVTKPRHARGTLVVSRTSPRAGTRHRAGTKVKLTLRKR